MAQEQHVDLYIEAACESCGPPYTRETRVSASRNLLSVLPFVPNQAERLQKKVERIQGGNYAKLAAMPCPECKYTAIPPKIVLPQNKLWR